MKFAWAMALVCLLVLPGTAHAAEEYFFPLDALADGGQTEVFLAPNGIELSNANPAIVYLYPKGKDPRADKFVALTISNYWARTGLAGPVSTTSVRHLFTQEEKEHVYATLDIKFWDPKNKTAIEGGWVPTRYAWTPPIGEYYGQHFPAPFNREDAEKWFKTTGIQLMDSEGNPFAHVVLLWTPFYETGTFTTSLEYSRLTLRNIFIKLHPRYQGVLNARYALAATTGPASPIAPPEKTGEAPTPGSIVPAGYRLGPDNQLIPLNPDGSIGTPVAPAPTANANPSTIVAATQKSENYRAWLLYPDIGESLLQALANANYAIVQKILALAEKPSGAPASPPTSVPNTVSLDAPKILKPAFAYWIAPDNSTTFAARMTTPEKRASELARFEIWALNGATMEPAEKLRIETKKEFVKSWKTLDGVEVSGYFLALDLPAGKTFAVRRKNDSGIYQDNFVTIAIQADKSIHVREDKRPDLFKP